MDQLKPVMTRYLNITKRLNETNAAASELRDQRRTVELDLAALYAHPPEPLPEKIDLTSSHMVFSVKKPGQWKKGWTLSKKQLEEYLLELLPEHGADLFKEIVMRHEAQLVSTDYAFEMRVKTPAE